LISVFSKIPARSAIFELREEDIHLDRCRCSLKARAYPISLYENNPLPTQAHDQHALRGLAASGFPGVGG
jgi:hypothetical protein